jgi:hypothetical protein
MAWNWLARYRKWYLTLSIIFLWLAGIMTYFSLQTPNIIESNLMLTSAIERFGLWMIFLFDAGASIIFILINLITKNKVIFNVCMMLVILSATALDLTNNLTLLYARPLYDLLGFAKQEPLFSSFTRAEYDGLYLRDFIVSCIGGNEIFKAPIGKPVYVGADWVDIYKDRNSTMHC